MTRIDRKTGEPILSPKLTVDQLYAMANEPGWRPWMRLIAEHPNAWPGLVDWWRTACFASMFVRQVRQCFSAVWADGFPRCRHRFPVM